MNAPFPFAKMQGVGNDFVVVDSGDLPTDTGFPALSAVVCDRHFGVGADGLMVLLPSEVADIRAQMFNPDGTEDFCGNGTRCVARFAYECGRIGADATIETKAGIRTVHIGLLENGQFREATLSLGRAQFDTAALPINVDYSPVLNLPLDLGGETVPISVVSTGSTHAIVWTDAPPDDETFFRLSPLLENHPIFPERTSVMWTTVTGPHELTLRIWERGAGETLGCGSGACAAATLARVEGKISEPGAVTVLSRGGTLNIGWRNDDPTDEIYLTGNAARVYDGVFKGA